MPTQRTTVVIVGAGPAGLAMSHGLTAHGIDHVLLERGDVANSWRNERWDGLRLLTPDWMNRLPGDDSPVEDADGYPTAAELVSRLDRYRQSLGASVMDHTTVTGLRPAPSGFAVATDHGSWRCRAVVVATGAAGTPRIPAVAEALPPGIQQLHALAYRNPDSVATGEVLVVGASASGVQIADELLRAGRQVTIAAGEHVWLPRTYRGSDIQWWMRAVGLLDERHHEVDDLARARRLPSPQLIGTPERRSLDLATLHAAGAEITGRLAGIDGGRAQFSGSLANLTASADLKLDRLLDRIDQHVDAHGPDAVDPPDRPGPTRLPPARTEIPLTRFAAVIWATGHRPHHPWLDPALLDRHGRIRHDGGVMDIPGMYVLGMPITRRRSSTFLHGIGADAVELTDHLVDHLARSPAARPRCPGQPARALVRTARGAETQYPL